MTTTDLLPAGVEDSDAMAAGLARAWLDGFAGVVQCAEVAALHDVFLEDSWWRDLLVMQPDLRTAHGLSTIVDLYGPLIADTRFDNIALSALVPPSIVEGVLTFSFGFTTRIAIGNGVARLRQDAAGTWRAWTVLTLLSGLIGYEEIRTTLADAAHAADSKESWAHRRRRESEFVDAEPDVLVVGAGHAGLNVAARLQHLGLKTLICEKTQRLGDVWRLRYHNLCLHDTKWYGQMAYMPYPDTWPVFAPKELVADWFEAYAWMFQLNAWTDTEVLHADFDASAQRWTVSVRREGQLRQLHPSHIIFATGAFAGATKTPEVKGVQQFRGDVVHSSQHAGGPTLAGKRVVVVGTGASGMDVAQDACESGAIVTMVQRGPTYVISTDKGVPELFRDLYSEVSPPVDIADLISLATPWHLFLDMSKPLVDGLAELDKDIWDGLRQRGFRLTKGPKNGGLFELSLTRGGGYYIDKGCCRLIAEGSIGLQHGEIVEFTKDSVVFADGSSQPADIVVFATGWPNMRENVRTIVGDDVADQLTEVWGLDDEGEIRGLFRPSGHPHLWYMAGGFQQSRYGSKLLALQIKSQIAGLR